MRDMKSFKFGTSFVACQYFSSSVPRIGRASSPRFVIAVVPVSAPVPSIHLVRALSHVDASNVRFTIFAPTILGLTCVRGIGGSVSSGSVFPSGAIKARRAIGTFELDKSTPFLTCSFPALCCPFFHLFDASSFFLRLYESYGSQSPSTHCLFDFASSSWCFRLTPLVEESFSFLFDRLNASLPPISVDLVSNVASLQRMMDFSITMSVEVLRQSRLASGYGISCPSLHYSLPPVRVLDVASICPTVATWSLLFLGSDYRNETVSLAYQCRAYSKTPITFVSLPSRTFSFVFIMSSRRRTSLLRYECNGK